MSLFLCRIGTLGLATLAIALPAVASAQTQSEFTKSMGIDQKLGGTVPMDATFQDETGATRTFGSLFKGRPVLVVPFPLKRTAGCGIAIDGLQQTLFRSGHPNQHKLFEKPGSNLLQVGKTIDLVFLSLDPTERPTDAATTKNEFEKKVNPDVDVEPVTALTGDAANIRRVTDALGFRYFYDPQKGTLRNPTGSALLTPDGHISSYTIGNDYQTKVMEANLEIAQTNRIGTKADASQMFGCVQLDSGVIARRGKIEGIITGFALLTLAVVVGWIGSMLYQERKSNRDLGGQPGGA